MKLFLFMVAFLLANLSCTKPVETAGIGATASQKRLPGESFADAESRYRSGLNELNLNEYTSSLSVMNSSKALADLDYSQLPSYDSLDQFTEAFEKGRDYRFLTDSENPGVLRRSSWLYPDDGCFARADLLAKNISLWGYPSLMKVFVFGELEVSTVNSLSNKVYWWFHIVPIANVAGQPMVMDPAVEPEEPLALEDWLARIAPNPQDLKLGFCSLGSYIPYSRCLNAVAGNAERATTHQAKFLPLERERLEALGRDPGLELGDSPPWLSDN